MKKAQLEQPFIFIFGIIVIALVILLGSNVIRNSLKLGNDVELNVFIDKFQKEVNNCYNLDFGSVCSINDLNIPNSLNYICVINLGEEIDFGKLPSTINDTIIRSVEIGRKDNVFFDPLKRNEEKVRTTLDRLKAAENPLCSKIINGKINLILENKGTFVEIRK